MNRSLNAMLVTVTLVAAAAVTLAQDKKQEPAMTPEMEAMMKAGTPSEAHRNLDQLVGEWTGTFKAWGEDGAIVFESSGRITREWVLDGHYLRESLRADTEWGSYEGVGYIGFDNIDGVYSIAWMDNMSTTTHVYRGTYDSAAKAFAFTGSMRDPLTSRVIPVRSLLDVSNPNRHVGRDYHVGKSGKEYKSFEGVAERVTK